MSATGSSNVSWFRYLRADQVLEVGYLTLGVYRYWPVTEKEAASMLFASSRGKWIWDNIRVRGSRTEHQKVYGRVT